MRRESVVMIMVFEQVDYDRVRAEFSWEEAAAELPRLPDGSLNIAHAAIDAHLLTGHGDDVALRCIADGGDVTAYSYADLSRASSRFAHLLRDLGVGKGDRVMSLLGRQVEQYVVAMGTLKNLSVFSPLFSSFGPEPIRQRLLLADTTMLVTTPSLYRRKVAAMRADLPALRHVLLVGGRKEDALDLDAELATRPDTFDIPPTTPRTWRCST